MSHRNVTRSERSTEISHLAAALWLNAELENFEACIELAGDELDTYLQFADAWDEAVSAARSQVAVPSHSRPGLVHTVDLTTGSCTCEAHQFRGRCKHVAEARKAA